MIDVAFDPELVTVLAALDAPLRSGVVGDERLGVEVDQALDAQLERVIDRLTEIRWKYEPGRVLQFELPLLAEGEDHGPD